MRACDDRWPSAIGHEKSRDPFIVADNEIGVGLTPPIGAEGGVISRVVVLPPSIHSAACSC